MNKLIDHTNLKAVATIDDIEKLCNEAKRYNFKSVCVNPVNVSLAKKLLEGSGVLVCTVIGFPLGANTTKIKMLETIDSVNNGADEVDMVINVAKAKEHDFDYIEKEIASVVSSAGGRCVKVIIETCYLDKEEIIACSKACMASHATFVKTSTGFGTGGAKVEDVALIKETVGDAILIKASGGIRTYEDAVKMVEAGANRLGVSASVAIMEEEMEKNR